MTQQELYSKDVLLASGVSMPRSAAAAAFSLVETMLQGTPRDRDLVRRYREAALKIAPLPDEMRAELTELGFLDEAGSLDPVARAVVLAVVRGEGTGLFAVTPYVTPWDRVLSDLIVSRHKVRAKLPPDQAELLIASHDVGDSNTERELRRWVSVVRRPGHGPGNSPPPSPN